MKKSLFTLIASLSLFVNAQTPSFEFDLKKPDYEMCHRMNNGYVIAFGQKANIISKNGLSQTQIVSYNNSKHNMMSKIATDGQYFVSVLNAISYIDYRVTLSDENGKVIKEVRIDNNLEMFLHKSKYLNEKDKVKDIGLYYTLGEVNIVNHKIFIEFTNNLHSSEFLVADIDDPSLNFKRLNIKFPESKIAKKPDFNHGWRFIKCFNDQFYFYRLLYSDPEKNSGQMIYEFLSCDINGNLKKSYYTKLETDKEDEMKYDVGCYIPPFDSTSLYIVRNFEYHGETELVFAKYYSGVGKQRAGFEVIKCNLSDGKIIWSNYFDYIDDKKNGFSGFSGSLVYQTYHAYFPLDVSFAFGKIILTKWAFCSISQKTTHLGTANNIRQVVILNPEGKMLMNKVMNTKKKEEDKQYLTQIQDEDIKDQPFYSSLISIKKDNKKKLLDILYFDIDHYYAIIYDEKLKKCLVYK